MGGSSLPLESAGGGVVNLLTCVLSLEFVFFSLHSSYSSYSGMNLFVVVLAVSAFLIYLLTFQVSFHPRLELFFVLVRLSLEGCL